MKRKPTAATAADRTYTYSGPLTGATLDDGREVVLHPGADVALPPGDSYVTTLVAMNRLQEKATPAAAPAPSKKEEITNAG